MTPVDHNPEALRWLRVKAGWCQAPLARAVGVSPSLLCEAEAGTRGLSATVKAELARVLDCPITMLDRPAGIPQQTRTDVAVGAPA